MWEPIIIRKRDEPMRVGVLLLTCLLAGCAAQNPGPRPVFSISDGAWEGPIRWDEVRADESKASGTIQLALAACSGEVRVWTQRPDGTFGSPLHGYLIDSNVQSHAIHFVDAAEKQPDWVEIQTFTMLEIDDNRAVIQWTRAVNNRDLPATDRIRTFFYHGIGKLKRISTVCQPSAVPRSEKPVR